MNLSLQSNLLWQYKKIVIYRRLAENGLVFLLQYSGLMLSTLVSHPTVMWLASGTACGFVFLRGLNVLPGIWLGSFIAYYFAHAGVGIASACASIYALQAGLLLWLSYRFISPTLLFSRAFIFIKFVIACGFLTALTSLLLVYVCYAAFSFPLWLLWWLANFNGIIVLAFTLIAWDAYFPEFTRLTHKSASFLYAIAIIFLFIILFKQNLTAVMSFALLTLPLTMIVSVYFGWCGVMAAVFFFGLLLTLGTQFSSNTVIFLQFLLLHLHFILQ